MEAHKRNLSQNIIPLKNRNYPALDLVHRHKQQTPSRPHLTIHPYKELATRYLSNKINYIPKCVCVTSGYIVNHQI